MIVGTKNINYDELSRRATSVESLKQYSLELVPRYLRHIPAIVNNQRYLVALYTRNIKAIPFYKKREMCESLLDGCYVTGYIDKLIDFYDVLVECDFDTLLKALEERG